MIPSHEEAYFLNCRIIFSSISLSKVCSSSLLTRKSFWFSTTYLFLKVVGLELSIISEWSIFLSDNCCSKYFASSSSPTTEIKVHFAPRVLTWLATIAAPPKKFLFSSSFTTTTGASALKPSGSQAAYWSIIESPTTNKWVSPHFLIKLINYSLNRRQLLCM